MHALPCIKYNSTLHPTEFDLFVSQRSAGRHVLQVKWEFYAHFVRVYSEACLPIFIEIGIHVYDTHTAKDKLARLF